MTNLSYILSARTSDLLDTQNRISDLIANQNTTGFKTEKNIFNELVLKDNNYDISFSRIHNTKKDFSQGTFIKTERPLDLAIEGSAFFKINTPEGYLFTRKGSFQINENGDLVTSEGYLVSGQGGNNISFPEDAVNISIREDGNIIVNGESIGNLSLVTFDNQQLLEKHPNGLYSYDGEEKPNVNARLHQGMLEASNVNNIEEMTNLVDVSNNISLISKIESLHHEQQMDMIKSLTK